MDYGIMIVYKKCIGRVNKWLGHNGATTCVTLEEEEMIKLNKNNTHRGT